MALVLQATILTMREERPVIPAGRVFVDDDGRIEAVISRGQNEPSGYEGAARVRSDIICPGLIDLHNHMAFNAIPLWIPPRQTGFPTRYSWSGDKKHYRPEVYLPAVIQGLTAGKALLKYAEVKAIVGGATGIQGSAKLSKPYEGWLIRNVEDETFGRGKAFDLVRQSVLPIRDTQIEDLHKTLTSGKRFLYHLSEGISDSLRKEYNQLRDNDLLQPGLVGIHSTALTAADFAEWATKSPGSVVWSPLSNLLLYGKTTDVVSAIQSGHTVAMGADWSPTGSKNMLGELKVADLVNKHTFGGALTDAQLVAMASRNGARALGWDGIVGQVAEGQWADLLLTERTHPDPHRSVVLATEADVSLVVVGGRPTYGRTAAMKAAQAINPEPLNMGRLRRSISLVNPAVADADMSWPQVLQSLADAANAPRGFARGAEEDTPAWVKMWDGTLDSEGLPQLRRSRSADPADEPLMLLPDLPPDLDADPDAPASRAIDPAELLDIVVPPVDTLITDKRFLTTAASSPIAAGAFDGLAQYWA